MIAAVFFAAGLLEVLLNPFLGRLTDRVGRLPDLRVALTASVGVAVVLAGASGAALIAVLICAAAASFGSMYTPSMALTTAPRPVSRRGSRSES